MNFGNLFRFQKTKKFGKSGHINISNGGVGASIGTPIPGLRVGINKKGIFKRFSWTPIINWVLDLVLKKKSSQRY